MTEYMVDLVLLCATNHPPKDWRVRLYENVNGRLMPGPVESFVLDAGMALSAIKVSNNAHLDLGAGRTAMLAVVSDDIETKYWLKAWTLMKRPRGIYRWEMTIDRLAQARFGTAGMQG